MPMGPPAREVQGKTQRDVRAGEGFGVIFPTALDIHFEKHQELEESLELFSRPRLHPCISLNTQP